MGAVPEVSEQVMLGEIPELPWFSKRKDGYDAGVSKLL